MWWPKMGEIERVAVAHADAEQESLVAATFGIRAGSRLQHPLWETLDFGQFAVIGGSFR
jgi:hypothetical protein